MKKILILLVLSLLTAYCSLGQDNKFEKKLQLFKFNLNEVLEQYDYEKISKLNFSQNDTLILIINKFVSENKHEIRQYREFIFEKNANNQDVLFDIEKYEKVDLTEINKLLDSTNLISQMMPMTKLMFINPMSEIEIYKTIYLSRLNPIKEIALHSVKQQITSFLLKTRKIDENIWEIIKNYYDIILKCNYDLSKGEVTNIQIFKRKSNKD